MQPNHPKVILHCHHGRPLSTQQVILHCHHGRAQGWLCKKQKKNWKTTLSVTDGKIDKPGSCRDNIQHKNVANIIKLQIKFFSPVIWSTHKSIQWARSNKEERTAVLQNSLRVNDPNFILLDHLAVSFLYSHNCARFFADPVICKSIVATFQSRAQ